MPEHNPNRDLAAEQVVHLFAKNLPHLVEGLAADRSWLWYSGDKPTEDDRKTLLDLGFRFTGRPHTCEDGRVAHWYHACGGIVYRRRSERARTRDAEDERDERHAAPEPQQNPALTNLAALAAVLP